MPCGVSMDEEIFSHVASETDDVMWNRLCYGKTETEGEGVKITFVRL